MKCGLIPPIPDLPRFVGPEATYHLALSHLLDSPLAQQYSQFYLERAYLGNFITLDNGAKERGEGSSLALTLRQALQVGASEVVLPDVIKDKVGTKDRARDALAWLVRAEGRAAFASAGRPRLMIVPQGATRNEWRDCLYELYELVQHTFMRIDERLQLTVGVAYHYNHMFQDGVLGLLATGVCDMPGVQIHMLGWVRDLTTLTQVRDYYPKVRSVDSSRPFVYAKGGLLVGEGPYPSRGEKYFEEPIKDEFEPLVLSNIETFRRFAGDR